MGTISTEKLMKKLENQEKIFIAYIGQLTHPRLASAYASAGVDSIILDLEHGPFNPENIGDIAAEYNALDFPVIARIQDCEYHCISKCIDQGCDAILVPRTETLAQVETAISSMRFHPIGKKGVGGRACLRGDSIEEFNRKRLIFIQIESPLGVDTLDEMLTRYGNEIAGVIIGPYDLSIMCETPLDFTGEKFLACVHKTIEICKSHNKSVGMFMDDLEAAKKWADSGMNIFWTAPEAVCMQMGLKAFADGIAEL